MPSSSKTFITYFTFEEFLSSVCPHTASQRTMLTTTAITVFTLEPFLLGLLLMINFEISSPLNLSSRFLSSVCLHVSFQMPTLATTIITKFTFERLFSSVWLSVNSQRTALATTVIINPDFNSFSLVRDMMWTFKLLRLMNLLSQCPRNSNSFLRVCYLLWALICLPF